MLFDFFKKKKELEKMDVKEILAILERLRRDLKEISREIDDLKKKNKFNIQKVGIVRFNPFQEIGGNQSFSLALLDGEDNGVVITSLYTREGNRLYGKPIKKGVSEYLLSEEEKKAIEKAKYGEDKRKLNSKTTGSSGPRSY